MGKRFFRHATVAGVVCAWLASGGVPTAQQPAAETPLPNRTSASTPDLFSGQWDYNDDESINAGTGRREQNPQSATARSASGNASNARRGSANTGGTASGFDRSSGDYRATPTMTPGMIRDAENFVRDMLEIPEVLQIRASGGEVTFIDDLARERTYPADGKGRDYQLSASKFEAKVLWDGSQLKRELEGGSGFKIFETYFLSENAARLFVIIRVKAPGRPGFIAGFNRVYDRVSPPAGQSSR